MGYGSEFVAIAVAAILAILLLMCVVGGRSEGFSLFGGSKAQDAKTFYMKLGGVSGMNIAALHCLPEDKVSPGIFLQAVVDPGVVAAGVRGFVVAQSAIVQRAWIKSTPAVAISRADGVYVGYGLNSVDAVVKFLMAPPASAKLT